MIRTNRLPFLLIILALLCAPLPALAQEGFYFRVVTASASPSQTTPPAVDPGLPPGMGGGGDTGLPPGMSNGGPPSAGTGNPGMGGTTQGLVQFSALPGWTYHVPWAASPALSKVEILGSGSSAQLALSVNVRGCATSTLIVGLTSGSVGFQSVVYNSAGACTASTPDEWAAVSGQPVPGSFNVVSAGSLPAGGGESGWSYQGIH